MLQNSPQQIFIYGSPMINTEVWEHLTENHRVQTFQTDNIYQLQQYTQEILPQILIFNINDAVSLVALKQILARLKNMPLIILLSPPIEISNLPQVAHHLHHPVNLAELTEIVESYSLGHHQHDALLLDSPSQSFNPLKQKLLQAGYSVFETHTVAAAQLYLQKNSAHAVLIEYMPQFIAGRHHLQHERIFYVDRQQDITEISKFLH